jgi:hypothetical protein
MRIDEKAYFSGAVTAGAASLLLPEGSDRLLLKEIDRENHAATFTSL